MPGALTSCGRTRREFLWQAGGGFVGTALTYLLAQDGFFGGVARAAEKLADCGYQLLRMGSAVGKKIDTTHPGIIDYAISGKRTDFLDIYLSANCRFFISSGSGIDSVPTTDHDATPDPCTLRWRICTPLLGAASNVSAASPPRTATPRVERRWVRSRSAAASTVQRDD